MGRRTATTENHEKVFVDDKPVLHSGLIAYWQKIIHEWAKYKGFHEISLCEVPSDLESEPQGINHDRVASKLALVHSEISEALEDLRDEKIVMRLVTNSKGLSEPVGLEVELADAVIRILDLAQGLGLDIENAIYEKMIYNQKREYKHGRKI